MPQSPTPREAPPAGGSADRLDVITERARQAARTGRWAAGLTWYHHRAGVLAQGLVTAVQADALCTRDQQVLDQARVAHAVLAYQLRVVVAQHQRLVHLHHTLRQIGVLPPTTTRDRRLERTAGRRLPSPRPWRTERRRTPRRAGRGADGGGDQSRDAARGCGADAAARTTPCHPSRSVASNWITSATPTGSLARFAVVSRQSIYR